MFFGTGRFQIERQDGSGGRWQPVAICNSLDYVRILTNTGFRNFDSVSYRIKHVRTGRHFVLKPVPAAASAGSAGR